MSFCVILECIIESLSYILCLNRVVSSMADGEGFVARVRGLPWSCSVDEVQRFFSGKKVLCLNLFHLGFIPCLTNSS